MIKLRSQIHEILFKGILIFQIHIAVEGPSKADITMKDNMDGTVDMSYLPTAPGEYNIIVKVDDEHIFGSPFSSKITGENGC